MLLFCCEAGACPLVPAWPEGRRVPLWFWPDEDWFLSPLASPAIRAVSPKAPTVRVSMLPGGLEALLALEADQGLSRFRPEHSVNLAVEEAAVDENPLNFADLRFAED